MSTTRSSIPWSRIEAEFVGSGASIRELARRHTVGESSIRAHMLSMGLSRGEDAPPAAPEPPKPRAMQTPPLPLPASMPRPEGPDIRDPFPALRARAALLKSYLNR
jgi:hypothetical protein